ncbi:TonB-dependent receptor [uncultured Erythrobacter sp.]|uniref:TonB-dependent receptor n=1 Tax=uncultured Erythrobacter sp. TaxID=263913 RepID=UPI002622BCA0|nr:TonB-dependent receptor [uncultured Erythrobacter sp.]
MKLKYLLAASVVSLTAATTIATPAYAQTITSGVEGTVTDESGAVIAGASVVVTDTRTNSTRETTSGSGGGFRVEALAPGGPYTVTVTAPGFEGQTVENIFTNISGNTSFDFALSSENAGNVIVVTGARAQVSQVAVGPGTAFGTEVLESFPSITRDIRDIIRIDPRVSLERSDEVDRISCLGGNDRTNTFTVDGIVQSDVFGLNGTPFAARNSLPLPFDVIEQTSVEFAPFDVEYTDFTGCLVNVVTKAGTNEFHGSAFYTYFDSGLTADEVTFENGLSEPIVADSEERWGVTLNGPIIPDRLFFSFGYEETDLGDGFNGGPAGSGAASEFDFVTQAQFDQFSQIANDVYGQDIGPIPTTLAETSIRYFGRLDAQINDDHRIVGTYQRLEESNIEDDFGGDQFGGLNSFEDEGTTSDTYSFQWYADWSDTVSTELRLSRAEVTDVQGPLGFGEAQSDDPTVRLVVGVEGPGDNGTLATGPGIFRSANALQSEINQARFIMNVDAGAGHFFKIGAEVNDLEVFNLFAINATGTLFFNNLDDFAAGLISGGSELFPSNDEIVDGSAVGADINVATDFDINNAAAQFSRQIYSFFAQDDWQATDQLSLSAGVRVQLFDGDAPLNNPLFTQRFGFSNAVPFSTIDPVILPRFAATYELDNDGFFSGTRLTAGAGIFTGGDPVVFFSNAFSNTGFTTGLGTTNACSPDQLNIDPVSGQPSVLSGGAFTGIPQCVLDAGEAEASAGGADVDSTAPDFDIPTAVRLNFGLASEFGTETGFFSNWRLNFDYIYTRFNDTLNITDLTQIVDPSLGAGGFASDGRPIIRPIDPINAGCNATLVDNTPPTFSGVTPECFGTGIDDFLQLNNGPSFDSHNASLLISKRFSEGVFTEGGSVNLSMGYAFNDSEETIAFRSATASSNFDNTPAVDRQNLPVAQSGFETRHNFVVALNFREEFIDGFDTGLGIFFRAAEGRPYSLVHDDGFPDFTDSSSAENNLLLYVPTGVDDPLLSPNSDPAAVTRLISVLNGTDPTLATNINCDFTPGEIIERNSCRNPWFFDMDLRFSQELPFIGSLTGIKDDRLEVFADIDNFLNLLGSDGNQRGGFGGFDGRVTLTDLEFDDTGLLVIDNFDEGDLVLIDDPTGDDNGFTSISNSIWRIQLGVRYEF